jgi:hypothetical protein
MRFMMIIKADEQSETGALPSQEIVDAMNAFNEELVRAGVLLEAEGLHPSAKGARITFRGGRTTVTDGPFPETKELIAGYWIIRVGSRQEAIEWAKRVPHPTEGNQEMVIDLRQIFELEEFPPEILTPEAAAREQAMREKIQKATR